MLILTSCHQKNSSIHDFLQLDLRDSTYVNEHIKRQCSLIKIESNELVAFPDSNRKLENLDRLSSVVCTHITLRRYSLEWDRWDLGGFRGLQIVTCCDHEENERLSRKYIWSSPLCVSQLIAPNANAYSLNPELFVKLKPLCQNPQDR